MAASDNIIYVDTSAARTLTLPVPTNGRLLTIKDSTGSAATNNITINQHSAEKIDGANSFTITQNWGELQLQSNGTDWFTNKVPVGTVFPLLAPDGSASAPSYAFSAATGTGLYKSAANALGFASNGSNAGSISSAQLWTIGASGGTQTHVINGGFTSTGLSSFGSTSTNASSIVIIGDGTSASNPQTGSTQIAATAFYLGTSAATSSIRGFSSNIGTAAAAFTVGYIANFVGTAFTKGAGSTITNAIGIFQNQPSVGTNNAILADSSTFTGSWALNLASTNASTFGGPVIITGVTDGSDAAAGKVGEYVTSFQSATNAPTSNQYGDLTSISLTAGDWDVCISGEAVLNGATVTEMAAGVSTTTGNSGTGLVNGDTFVDIIVNSPTTYNPHFALPLVRASITGTTTYYLKMFAVYSLGTPQFRGRISARRIR